ncbi:MAG: TlpA family protein disulfide reductase [Fibromonadaceae bacterium]|nr:TlpA family protein disulfide reductase [Fibromonadaceae bacterium]
MRIVFFTAMFLLTFSFAEQFERLALPKELQGNIIPNFFVLAGNNKDELYRDDLKINAKKAGAKRVVLSFFATYCVSCREGFTVLKKNASELEKQGVQVYLINVGEDIHVYGNKVSEMVKKHAGNFPFYFDPYGNSLDNFGFKEEIVLPLTLVLDSDLRALGILVGSAGKDFPQVLWEEF